MNAIFKYPGSKWRIAKWIIDFFPDHHSYLEPFAGSLAVLMNKPRSHIETVNDLDGNVVNLFQWIKDDPEKLAHEIYYTPYSRQIYNEAFWAEPEDSLQAAVIFFYTARHGAWLPDEWRKSRMEERYSGERAGLCRQRLGGSSGSNHAGSGEIAGRTDRMQAGRGNDKSF